MRADYFEGILQLRDCSTHVERYIRERLAEEGVHVAKEITQANGVDLYVSSNKFLLKLRNELKKRFSGQTKLSRKLHTQDKQTGKRLYRMTLLFRQLPISVGDVIEYQGSEVRVMRMGKNITAKDLKTGKQLFIEEDEL